MAVMAVFGAVAVLVAFGISYLELHERQVMDRATEQLMSTAKLKSRQLASWLSERRSDAAAIQALPNLKSWIADTERTGRISDETERYFRRVAEVYGYSQVALLGRDSQPIWQLVAAASAPSFPEEFREALRSSDEPVMRDLFLDPQGAPMLEFYLSIRDAGGNFAGAVVLRMDARDRLYPLLAFSPSQRETAETLIVRREGDELLALSPLKGKPDAVLQFHLPVSTPGLVASEGLKGQAPNLIVGRDYRGVPVYAHTSKIEGAPWLLVAKIDQAELEAQVASERWFILGGLGVLLVSAGFVVLGLWRRHLWTLAVQREKLEGARQAAQARLGLILQHGNDAILICDENARLVEVNERMAEMYGYSVEKLLTMSVPDLRAPLSAPHMPREFAAALSGNILFETLHQRRDGSVFPVEVSARRVLLEGRSYVFSIIRDITVRKAHEREIEKLSQLYRVLSEVNGAIVRRQTEQEMFDAICEALVRSGGFRIAWVGLRVAGSDFLQITAKHGAGAEYFDDVGISINPERPEGRGPGGEAFRSGQAQIVNEVSTAPNLAPWRERAARFGIEAMAAFPLTREGEVIGVLGVYSGEKGFWGARETELLTEAAADLSFAIDTIAERLRRKEAEQRVNASEARIRHLVRNTPVVIYSLHPTTMETTYLSPNAQEVLGYSGEEFQADSQFWLSHLHPDDAAETLKAMEGLKDSDIVRREYRFRHRDGTYRWLEDEIRLLRDEEGQPSELVGYVVDATTRRLTEDFLRKISSAVEQSPVSIIITDLTGAIEYVNPRFTELTGYTLAEVKGRNPRLLKSGVTEASVFTDLWATITAGRVWRGEIINRKKNGELHTELAIITPVTDNNGRPTHFVGLKEDITGRKAAEENLRKLSRVVEQSPLSVVITDLTGAIEYVNPTFTEVTGYTRDEALGKNPRILKSSHTPVEVYREMWTTLKQGGIWRGELANIRKNGELFYESAVIAPVAEAHGSVTHYVAIKEDITEKKRTSRALAEAQENYRFISENVRDVVIWLYDLRADAFTYMSPSVQLTRGFPPERFIGKSIDESGVAAASREDVRRHLKERLNAVAQGDDSERSGQVEVLLECASGEVRSFEIFTTILAGDDGLPSRLIGISRDITARKQSEAELRLGRDRLAEAERMARLGNWEMDLQSGLITCSEEMVRIFGWESGAVVNLDKIAERLHPDERSRVLAQFHRAVEEGTPFASDHRIVLPDGQVKNIESNGHLLPAKKGASARMVGTVQDITERKRVETELHEAVKQLRVMREVSVALQDRSADLVKVLELTAQQLPSALRNSERARVEIQYGELVFAAGVEGELRSKTQQDLLLNGRVVGRIVAGYVAEPGVELGALHPSDEALIEALARSLGIGLGEREAFELTRRSEERFRAIFDHAETGMFEATTAGVITRANRFLGSLLGLEPQAIVGRHWTEFAVQESQPRPVPLNPTAVQSRRSDGQTFWGLLNSREETDATGLVIGCICLWQDISDQVAARETLLRFNAELERQVAERTAEIAARNREVRALIEAIPDLVMRMRADGTVVNFEAARGETPLAAFDPNSSREEWQQLLRESAAHGTASLAQRTTVSSELALNPSLVVELRVAPSGSDEFVVFGRDITSRKLLERDMAAMLERERQVSEMKSRFISVTSHEFRTPMAAVMGSVDLLRNHLDRLSPAKRAELFGRIASSLTRMTDMLEDVLTLNRLDSHKTEVRLSEFDLTTEVRRIITEVQDGDRGEHHFVFESSVERSHFRSDVNVLHHILSNLLSNAVRYSPAGTTISVHQSESPRGIEISVQDQGIGIPPEDHGRIFEPFERGSNVANIKGTGLGLNIVKRMTELLGGTIRLDAPAAGGSRFILTLPDQSAPPTAP